MVAHTICYCSLVRLLNIVSSLTDRVLYNLPECDTSGFKYNGIIYSIDGSENLEYDKSSRSVSTEEVIKVINRLKSNKSGGFSELSSNCFKEALFILHPSSQHILVLFSLFRSHGYVPPEILTFSMLPLVIGSKGDRGSSDNYRAISQQLQ